MEVASVSSQTGVNPVLFAHGGKLQKLFGLGLCLNVVEIGLTAKEIIPWRN